MLRPMVISVLAVDQLRETPVVILKEVGGDRTLSIWIGFLEAMGIASELQGIKFSRPPTHDLLKSIMGLTEVKVRKRVNARIFAAEEVIQKSRQIDLKAELEGKSERGKKMYWSPPSPPWARMLTRFGSDAFPSEGVFRELALLFP